MKETNTKIFGNLRLIVEFVWFILVFHGCFNNLIDGKHVSVARRKLKTSYSVFSFTKQFFWRRFYILEDFLYQTHLLIHVPIIYQYRLVFLKCLQSLTLYLSKTIHSTSNIQYQFVTQSFKLASLCKYVFDKNKSWINVIQGIIINIRCWGFTDAKSDSSPIQHMFYSAFWWTCCILYFDNQLLRTYLKMRYRNSKEIVIFCCIWIHYVCP